MNKYTDAILEKMKDPIYFELNWDFLFRLTNESERGAILIGTSKVEESLEKLIIKLFPLKQKTFSNKLLEYPGPLATFAGKIELLYAFRIIDGRLYRSLSALRKLRNTAAHSSVEFSFAEIKTKMEEIYDFESEFKNVVHKLSFDNLWKWKIDGLKRMLDEKGLDSSNYEELWSNQVPDPEQNETFQEHLATWKLAYGLTFICLKIEVIVDELDLIKEFEGTWVDKFHQIAAKK